MKVTGPIPSTSLSCSRSVNGPFSLRNSTTRRAVNWLRPETCRKSGMLAVFRSTPTKLTQREITDSSDLLELFRVHIVLVESDADVLGLDFDQFGQGILEAAADGDRAPQGRVEVGDSSRPDGTGGIDAAPASLTMT